MTAPGDSEDMLYRTTERDEEGRAKTIRVTGDPEATVFGGVDANVTHPYRQTEVVKRGHQGVRFEPCADKNWTAWTAGLALADRKEIVLKVTADVARRPTRVRL